MADTIKVTILEDGTIKIETDKVSMPNHTNAENFLMAITQAAGGTVERERKSGVHTHTHDGHTHTHEH
jgi:hypothetical protein